ncbi:MAG: ABC transporter permease subunit [Fusobacteriales bacterium]|jgi:NitT/TauT family transport system permease protein|nr:ABC transporter permease subunit [Fusobacteriales bacterium]
MKSKYLIFFLSVLVTGIIWELISKYVGNDVIFPGLISILREIKLIIFKDTFFREIYSTFIRILCAFLISIISSLILGIISANFRAVRIFLKPQISFIKYTPVIAVIVLVLIWFPKEISPLVIGTVISFPIFYDNIVGSINNIDTKIKKLINVFHINRKDSIIKLYFPALLSNLVNIASSVFGLILKTVIAGEIYSQPKYGVGSSILNEKSTLNTQGIIAWIIITVFFSLILDFAFRVFRNKVMFWRENG